MTKKLTFKEYIESKQILKSATQNSLRVLTQYSMLKYCKLPLVEQFDSEEKQYVALKPKDVIEILWECDDSIMRVKSILIMEEEKKYYPSWNDKKMHEWVQANTIRYVK